VSKSNDQLDAEKRLSAEFAARWIMDGSCVGLGSGSTAAYFIESLGKRVRDEKLNITGIATSKASEAIAREVGLRVIEPFRGLRIDFAVDGADEIDPELTLIKGGGGALLREKVIASNATYFLVIADSSKYVTDLGKFPLPIEVVPFASPLVMDQLEEMGGNPTIRRDKGSEEPARTDQANLILDCHFQTITDPSSLSKALFELPGVVDHGLFINLANAAAVATDTEVLVYRPGQPPIRADQFQPQL